MKKRCDIKLFDKLSSLDGPCLVDKLSPEKKLDILLSVMDKLIDEIHQLETNANKLTLFVCFGLLAAPVFAIEKLKHFDGGFKYISIVFILVITICASSYLYNSKKRTQWLCRATIRIQQYLGFYKKNAYLKIDTTDHELWIDNQVVFPLDSQRWGKDNWLVMHNQYIISIIISGILAAIILYNEVQDVSEIYHSNNTIKGNTHLNDRENSPTPTVTPVPAEDSSPNGGNTQ